MKSDFFKKGILGLFVCVLSMGVVNAQEEDPDDVMLALPTRNFLPIDAGAERISQPGSPDRYEIQMRSRAFEVSAPMEFKGWRMKRLANNQIVLENFLEPGAKVTFSLFNSFLFFQEAKRTPDWEDAYLRGLVLNREIAADVSANETFPDVGRFPHFLFGHAPKATIDYEKEHLGSGQQSLCRDIFIEYRADATKRYTLVIQFERPEAFPSKAFADVFGTLHAVDYLASIAK